MSVQKFPPDSPTEQGSTQVVAAGPINSSSATATTRFLPGVYEYEKFQWISGSLVPANTPGTPPTGSGSTATTGFDIIVGSQKLTASAGNVYLDSIVNSISASNQYWGTSASFAAGFAWTSQSAGFGSTRITGADYGASVFVAGAESGSIRTSTDGITWTARTSGFGSSRIYAISFLSSLFLAGGANGTLTTSTDGITWTTRTTNMPAGYAINAFTRGVTQYILVGSAAALRTSTNGTNWVTRTIAGFPGTIMATAFGNGIYIVTGDSGEVHSSTDAVTWTTRTAGFGSTILPVAHYGQGLFVVGSQDGQIRVSTDAITWTARGSGFTGAIRASIHAASLHIIGGDVGRLRVSTNTITWSSGTSATTNGIYCFAYNGTNTFMLGGFGGSVSTSSSITADYYGDTAIIKMVAEDRIVEAT